MAAKWFQTKTEEEIEQLLRDQSSKSTNKATHNDLFYMQITGICNILQ